MPFGRLVIAKVGIVTRAVTGAGILAAWESRMIVEKMEMMEDCITTEVS